MDRKKLPRSKASSQHQAGSKKQNLNGDSDIDSGDSGIDSGDSDIDSGDSDIDSGDRDRSTCGM